MIALGRLDRAYDGRLSAGVQEQMEEVFDSYEVDIVEFVCSPLTGIQRLNPHPPNIAEVINALEGRREHLRKLALAIKNGQRGVARDLERRLDPEPYVKPEYGEGHFATVTVPSTAPQYESLCERAKDADRVFYKHVTKNGQTFIMVPLLWMDQPVVKAAKEWKSWTPEELLAHYRDGGGDHLRSNMFSRENARRMASLDEH